MLFAALIFTLVFNLAGFLLSYSFQTDKLTDIFYVSTFVIIAVIGLVNVSPSIVHWVVSATVLVWAIKLGGYLRKRLKLIKTDARFDNIRNDFWKLGSFWTFQAVIAWVVALPMTLLFSLDIATRATNILWIGLAVSVIGILIESVSDKQKFKFASNPKNKGMWIDSGLWRYSRHPNYFGEILMWVGVYLMVAQWLRRPELYFAMLGPLTIAFMLLFVSGVPILEKRADKKFGKNKKYLEYKQNTSVLIPLPKTNGR